MLVAVVLLAVVLAVADCVAVWLVVVAVWVDAVGVEIEAVIAPIDIVTSGILREPGRAVNAQRSAQVTVCNF